MLRQLLRGHRPLPTETFLLRHRSLSRQELTEHARGSALVATSDKWEVLLYFACFLRLHASNRCRGSTVVPTQLLRGHRPLPTETFFLRHRSLSRHELTEHSRGSVPVAIRNRWEVLLFWACFPRLHTLEPQQLSRNHSSTQAALAWTQTATYRNVFLRHRIVQARFD